MSLILVEHRKLKLRCDACQIEFERPNWMHIRKRKTHKCSKKCHNTHQSARNPKRNKVCAFCGIKFRDESKRPDAGTCCSKKCTYEKMSKTRHEKGSYSAKTLYSNSKRGFRADIGIFVRSNWEANFARICEFLGKKWKYEPKCFSLKNGETYTPDFEIEGEGFIEIKGRSDSREAMKKYRSFIDENPDVVVKLISSVEYNKLRCEFRDQISWEGK